jgi:tripartite-type tricarboxylate transporter receptor subunit TctC
MVQRRYARGRAEAEMGFAGLEPVAKPAAELAALLRKQREEYGRVIREADIQAE